MLSAKWRTLAALATAELLAMSLWFSATAVAPALAAEWHLTQAQTAWLTMAVQLGFVFGALLSAVFNLPDLWAPKKVMAAGACTGALLNAAIPALDLSFQAAVAARFATGMTLAAVYPVGMKIMATWTKEDRGLGIGLLVGALTVGSASPHLVRAAGGIHDWEGVLYAVSVLALLGAAIALRYGDEGPYRSPAPKLQWRYFKNALAIRPIRLANFGYLGHMWELYAMWTWMPAFLLEIYGRSPHQAGGSGEKTAALAALAAFAVIAAGGPACVLAGKLADRWGRTRTTILSMTTSGACALAIGWMHSAPVWAVTALALLWGFSIVADSAQFSTSISELSDPAYMGTQLTAQTSMGFLLTMASIQLVPIVKDSWGWGGAFSMLAMGPAAGTAAMWLLQRSPEASRLAGGRG
ncbi:MAG: MFS transporter [Gemmatimonadales bacterium]|nr:MAG: MFS transporter [Gemmatimonadales bacterium]